MPRADIAALLALSAAVFIAIGNLFPGSPLALQNWTFYFNTIAAPAIVGTGLFAQVYRYRRISTALERQQTKWVVYGITLGVGCFLLLVLIGDAFPFLFPTVFPCSLCGCFS